MNTAILTQRLCKNYGGIMQAYALSTVLAKMGHTVRIVDGPYAPISVPRRCRAALRRWFGKPDREAPYALLSEFVRVRLPMTEKIVRSRNFPHFDAWVVGSDQVWRPQYSPDIGAFFLDFLPPDATVRRVAYAASFGVDDWEFDPPTTAHCRDGAARFDAIGVREDSAVALVRDHLGAAATQVPDPTLLLEAEAYRAIAREAPNPATGGLFSYVLDESPEKGALQQQIGLKLGLRVQPFLPSRRRFKTEPGLRYPSLPDWLAGIAGADFVLTDSFHGTVFALLFKRPFLVVGNARRGLTRFQSLLGRFGLESRLNPDCVTEPMDFTPVHARLAAERARGRDFLQNALSVTRKVPS